MTSRRSERWWSKSNSSRVLRAGKRAARMRASPPWAWRAATSRSIAAYAAAAIFGFLAGDRPDDPSGEPSVWRREVVVAPGNDRHPDTTSLHQVDERLKLSWRTVQAVVVPGDDRVKGAVFDRRQHRLIGAPLPAAIRRSVVVLVVLRDLPAASGAECLAIDALSFDAGALASGSQEIRV